MTPDELQDKKVNEYKKQIDELTKENQKLHVQNRELADLQIKILEDAIAGFSPWMNMPLISPLSAALMISTTVRPGF